MASFKFGTMTSPLPCTRLLGKFELTRIQNRNARVYHLIVINEVAETFTVMVLRDGLLGKKFDPATCTFPLTDGKDHDWSKKGYSEYNVDNFDVVTRIEAPVEA